MEGFKKTQNIYYKQVHVYVQNYHALNRASFSTNVHIFFIRKFLFKSK